MNDILNQDISSLEMKQKYKKELNGTTIIKYYLDFNFKTQNEVFLELTSFTKTPSFLNFDAFCTIENNFQIQYEGQFFVKASSYQNNQDLIYARQLAIEDNLRYQLFHNKLNESSCSNIHNITTLLSTDYPNFYQSFVLDSENIIDLYKSRNKNTNLEEIAFKDFQEGIKHLRPINSEEISTVSNMLDYSFKTFFEKNSNIIFSAVDNDYEANLVIIPYKGNDTNSLAADLKVFQGEELQKMFLLFPIFNGSKDPTSINDYAHGLAHIFLDHPCENYYPCGKGSVQARTPNIEYLTIMSQKTTIDISNFTINPDTQIIQSLLPWDLAALRNGYGMPTPQNTTYYFNNINNLKEIFSVDLYNNTLITLSSVGYNIINAESVKFYEIDLRYNTLSHITNHNISLKFILSYDTEISEIIVNSPGDIILNPNYPTNISITNKAYNFNLLDSEQCPAYNYGLGLIQIYNYNESIHDIYFV